MPSALQPLPSASTCPKLTGPVRCRCKAVRTCIPVLPNLGISAKQAPSPHSTDLRCRAVQRRVPAGGGHLLGGSRVFQQHGLASRTPPAEHGQEVAGGQTCWLAACAVSATCIMRTVDGYPGTPQAGASKACLLVQSGLKLPV